MQRGSSIFLSKDRQDKKLARQLDEARRKARGLKVCDWQFTPESTPDHGHLVESVVEWCRQTMSSTRRPYGVDHFDLVLSLRAGEEVRNLSFSRLRTLQLYDDSLYSQVMQTLARELRETGSQAVHIAAGLFSWGDALYSALRSDEPQSAAI